MPQPDYHPTSYRQKLLPLPLRVATGQKERLDGARDRTGISVQEHVRRAIDLYLAIVEKEHIELGLMPPPDAEVLTVQPIRPKTSQRSVRIARR